MKRLGIYSYFSTETYYIQPNYCTVLLAFQNYLEHSVVLKYVSNYLGYIYYIIKKKDQKRTYLMTIMQFSFLIFFIKAYVVGTHLNCIDKSMQFK